MLPFSRFSPRVARAETAVLSQPEFTSFTWNIFRLCCFSWQFNEIELTYSIMALT
jgi:hypothetical protein